MSQSPVILPGSPLTGAAAAADMNAAWAAMISKFSGSSAPTLGPGGGGALVEGQDWLNTSTAGTISAPHVPYQWNGTIWVPKSSKTILTADTIYFFDSVNGNDNNSGLSSGTGAFKSFAVVNALVNSIDTNGKLLTLSLASGQSWSNFSLTVPVLGGGVVVLNGNSDTITTTTSAAAVTCQIQAGGGGALFNSSFLIENCTLTASGGGNCLDILSGNAVIYTGNTFGAVTGAGSHILVDSNNSRLFCQGNYTISGGATNHMSSLGNALIDYNNPGITVTLSGTPAFSGAFAFAEIGGALVSLLAYSGSATGTRYSAISNGVIYTNGAGATYFPGNGAGSTATGGQYV